MKYVRFIENIRHYQTAKFNGTEGTVIMTREMVGVYNDQTDTYVFDKVDGVVPEFISQLLRGVEGRMTSFYDGIHKTKFYDEQHNKNVESFEKRLFLATHPIDVSSAWLFFCAAEETRLSIKLAVNELFSATRSEANNNLENK